MRAAEKIVQEVTTRPTTDKQTIHWPAHLFVTKHFPFEKKTSPGQIRTRTLCLPRHIHFLQAKLAGNTENARGGGCL